MLAWPVCVIVQKVYEFYNVIDHLLCWLVIFIMFIQYISYSSLAFSLGPFGSVCRVSKLVSKLV